MSLFGYINWQTGAVLPTTTTTQLLYNSTEKNGSSYRQFQHRGRVCWQTRTVPPTDNFNTVAVYVGRQERFLLQTTPVLRLYNFAEKNNSSYRQHQYCGCITWQTRTIPSQTTPVLCLYNLADKNNSFHKQQQRCGRITWQKRTSPPTDKTNTVRSPKTSAVLSSTLSSRIYTLRHEMPAEPRFQVPTAMMQ
jgi:hypothetical protein